MSLAEAVRLLENYLLPVLESAQAEGELLVEKEAGEGAYLLAQSDSLPQTVTRVKAKAADPVSTTAPLRITR